ncbi:MAG: DMT family transporter [Planctomycetota bacterium]|nr:MAG: DMT family transporter [Planctomycetota bacterium]
MLATRRADDATLFKNTVAAAVLGLAAILLAPQLGGGAAGERDVPWLLLSGALGLGVGDWLYFLALAHIGVARTQILIQLVPVGTAMGAIVVYGEQLGALQWCGALVVIAGGLLVAARRPERRHADAAGIAAALIAVLLYVAANLMLRHGVGTTGVFTAGAWRLVGGACGLLLARTLRGQLRPALRALAERGSWRHFLLPTCLGTMVGLSFYAGGFKWAKSGVASSLSAAMPLFSIPLATLFLHERPGWRGWLGALLVLCGVTLIGLAAGT